MTATPSIRRANLAPRSNTLVIIPAYNEEESLPGVIADLKQFAPTLDVLVVVDGATDATAEVAYAHGATVATLPFNLGIGGALRTGFAYARAHGYERCIQFDGDGQHDAREIGHLLDALDSGFDMVIGSRFAGAGEYDAGRTRRGAMGMLRLLLYILAGQRFSDTSSGFRAFSRPVIEFFARSYPLDYMESVESLLLACYANFRVGEVPTAMHQRTGGAPSNRRFRLIYHYVRLMIVLVVSASRSRRQPTGTRG
ncbi:MAG TPA: glycosyltransferase family 2 protein [Acidimicrobiales bacterium]|nr:glycosyltransferase family 2 protein [Acidimicrobiales bacterium]